MLLSQLVNQYVEAKTYRGLQADNGEYDEDDRDHLHQVNEALHGWELFNRIALETEACMSKRDCLRIGNK